VAAVQTEIAHAIPALTGALSSAVTTSALTAKAERAIEPESIALGAFGAITALATLLIAGQLIGRQLRLGGDERAVLRALGASTVLTIGDGLPGVLAAVVIGALVAGVVVVGMSPLAPLGPVRHVEQPGIAFDWTVLGPGIAALIVVLSVFALAIAYRQAPHRIARRRHRRKTSGSRAALAAANAGLSAPAVTGIRFALEPGVGAKAVPVRSAIIGAVLAMIVVTSTLTFATSLNTLVSHPALYGWNWNYQLLSGFSGQEDLPQRQAAVLLNHAPDISEWTGIYFNTADIDSQPVPVIGVSPNAPVAPPLLSGHQVQASNQIVLGASTLADLHKHVGDTVAVQAGLPKPTTLRIVGTATMPTIGNNGGLHTTIGTGALFDYHLIPAHQRNLQGSPIPGPQAILIRTRRNANSTESLHALQHIAHTINTPNGGGGDHAGGVTGVLRPAEIVNYRSMGTTPALLGATLAFGAIAALGLTLFASVRRRRRELALLKALGLTRRQLAAVVAWQSTIAIALGIVIGVPLGIIIGHWSWNRFANAIHVVPQPTIPGLAIVLISVAALILANVVAALPGRQAASTPAGLLLQAE
jgi:FtsX-like permease family